MLHDALLLVTRQRPAGRIIGGVDDQDFGAGGHGCHQGRHVQRPHAVHGRQGEAVDTSAHDGGLCGQVGPHWRDSHHLIASIEQLLHGKHQRVDTATGHGHAVDSDRAMPVAHVDRDGLAQFRQAEVVGVKSLATLQRLDGGLANEVRRDFIALAKPERQHVLAAHAGIGYFTDTGLFKVLNDLAHGRVGL